MQLPVGSEVLHANRHEAVSYPDRIPGFAIGQLVDPGRYDVNDGNVMAAIPTESSLLVAISFTPLDNKKIQTGYLGNFDLNQPDLSNESLEEMVENVREDFEDPNNDDGKLQAWLGGACLELESAWLKRLKEKFSSRPQEIAQLRRDTLNYLNDSIPELDSMQADWLGNRERITMVAFDPAVNEVHYKVANL